MPAATATCVHSSDDDNNNFFNRTRRERALRVAGAGLSRHSVRPKTAGPNLLPTTKLVDRHCRKDIKATPFTGERLGWHGRMYNLRQPQCVLSRPTHANQRLLSRTLTRQGRVSKCQSSGVPHLVTYRRRRWAVRT